VICPDGSWKENVMPVGIPTLHDGILKFYYQGLRNYYTGGYYGNYYYYPIMSIIEYDTINHTWSIYKTWDHGTHAIYSYDGWSYGRNGRSTWAIGGGDRQLYTGDGCSLNDILHNEWIHVAPLSTTRKSVTLENNVNVPMLSTHSLDGFSHFTVYGWDGTQWDKDVDGSRPITDSDTHDLLLGISANFNNATGIPYNQQFIEGESIQTSHGLVTMKDNLQEYKLESKQYYCDAHYKEHTFTIPSTIINDKIVYTIPEKSENLFRDFDCEPIAYDKGIGMILHNITDDVKLIYNPDENTLSDGEFLPNRTDGTIIFHSSMAGKEIYSKYIVTYM